ncbi:MAG: hypothetical protein OXK80_06090 [Bdellovibrionales bacterium]|nr:hypothetical protein [Bdellovibrionales bacterium]
MSSTSYNLQREIKIPPSFAENLFGQLPLIGKSGVVFSLPSANETADEYSIEDTLYEGFDERAFSLGSYHKLRGDSLSHEKLVRTLFSSFHSRLQGDSRFRTAVSSAYEIDSIERAKIKLLIYEDMRQVFNENKQDNWDGYKAIGINHDHFNFAMEFMSKLFESDLHKDILEQVEVNPENYGNIAFDWFLDHDHQISISIRENKAVFNYKSNEKKFYGEVPVDDELDSIIDLIKSLYE